MRADGGLFIRYPFDLTQDHNYGNKITHILLFISFVPSIQTNFVLNQEFTQVRI